LRLQLGEALASSTKRNGKFCGSQDFRFSSGARPTGLDERANHPFTGIVDEDLEKLESAPWEVRIEGLRPVLNATSSAPAASESTARI